MTKNGFNSERKKIARRPPRYYSVFERSVERFAVRENAPKYKALATTARAAADHISRDFAKPYSPLPPLRSFALFPFVVLKQRASSRKFCTVCSSLESSHWVLWAVCDFSTNRPISWPAILTALLATSPVCRSRYAMMERYMKPGLRGR